MLTVKNLLSGEMFVLDRRSRDYPNMILAGGRGSGKTSAILSEIRESLDLKPADKAVVFCQNNQLDRYQSLIESREPDGRLRIIRLEDDTGRSSETDIIQQLKETGEFIHQRFKSKCGGKTWLYIDGMEVLCRHRNAFREFFNVLRSLNSRCGLFCGTIRSFERVVSERLMMMTLNACGSAFLFQSADSPGLYSAIYDLPVETARHMKELKKGYALLIHDAVYDYVSIETSEGGNSDV